MRVGQINSSRFKRFSMSTPIRVSVRWLFTMIVVAIFGMGRQSAMADPPVNSTANALKHPQIPTADEPLSLSPSERGGYLYETHCKACHGDRSGNGGTAGASPHNEKGHSWHHPDAQLIAWVLNGKFRAEAMPQFKSYLTKEDVRAILLFIKSWWTPEQRKIQQDISRRYQEALDRN